MIVLLSQETNCSEQQSVDVVRENGVNLPLPVHKSKLCFGLARCLLSVSTLVICSHSTTLYHRHRAAP